MAKQEVKKRVFKTKKVLSGVKTEYRAWKLWEDGDVIVGKLIGTTPNRKAKTKKDWILEVEDAFFADKKEQKRIIAGQRITLNCAGQLDKGMNQIEEGDLVQITYTGSKIMEGGDYAGDPAHTMEVVSVEEDNGEEDNEEYSEEEEDSDDL